MTLSMREMLAAAVHFGHRTRYWHPKMAPYIFGERSQIHIIDLEKTVPLFNDALNVLGKIAARGDAKILFVGTKYAASKIIKEQAERCGMPYVSHRWPGGMLTNYKTMRRSIKRLKDLDFMFEKQRFAGLTKKEILELSRERNKLERGIGGIKNMSGLPDILFIVDTGHEKIALTEAQKLRIPVVAVVDTNHDPSGIDYIIPGNDDSRLAIRFYAEKIADTVLAAKTAAAAQRDAEEEGPTIQVRS